MGVRDNPLTKQIMYDENFYADLQREEERIQEEMERQTKEQLNTEEKYIGEYEDGRDYKEEREADRMEEYFTREPGVY